MENEVQQEPKKITANSFFEKIKKNRLLFIAIVCILFLALASIIFTVLYSQNPKTSPTEKSQSSENKISGSVVFEPSSIELAGGKKGKVDILLNSAGKKISGVKVAIEYNPLILENVELTPYKDETSALSYSLEEVNKNVKDASKNTMIMTLSLPQGIQDLAGTGKIAELSFTVKPLKVAVTSTSITLTDLTGLLSSATGEDNKLTKNQVTITLPAGLPFVSPTIIRK